MIKDNRKDVQFVLYRLEQGYIIRWFSHEFRSSSFVPNRGTIAYRVRLGSRIVAQKWRSGNLINGVPVQVGNAIAIKWERRLQFNGNGEFGLMGTVILISHLYSRKFNLELLKVCNW